MRFQSCLINHYHTVEYAGFHSFLSCSGIFDMGLDFLFCSSFQNACFVLVLIILLGFGFWLYFLCLLPVCVNQSSVREHLFIFQCKLEWSFHFDSFCWLENGGLVWHLNFSIWVLRKFGQWFFPCNFLGNQTEAGWPL